MKYYITLYDRGYLSRGIALYQSLIKECKEEFKLFILAMDVQVETFWAENPEKSIEIITLNDLIDYYPVLLRLRQERTYAEFCWTLSAFSIQYALRKYDLPSCTYLDSDTYFYDDPGKLFREIGNESVLITEHNYAPENDKTWQSGKFCVQFMHFSNNSEGNEVLEWWRQQCEACCTMDPARGLCGDQKYLDDWESRFEGKVFNCRSVGCGVAPWNLQKYNVVVEGSKYYVVDKVSKVKRPIIFFHFHALLKISQNIWRMSGYKTGEDFASLIYRDYILRLDYIEKNILKNYKTELPVAEEIEIVRFQPVPFYGECTLDMEIIHNDYSPTSIMKVQDRSTNQISIIYYQKRNIKGQWISIKKIEGYQLVVNSLYEIIWKLQHEECYPEFTSINDVVYEIFRRKNTGEWMMTECPWHLLGNSKIEHPGYEIRPIVRVYKDLKNVADNSLEYFDVQKHFTLEMK